MLEGTRTPEKIELLRLQPVEVFHIDVAERDVPVEFLAADDPFVEQVRERRSMLTGPAAFDGAVGR